MNILILHRIPYDKIDYHRGIDHCKHKVVYCGLAKALETIPSWLQCEKWARAGFDNIENEVIDLVNSSGVHFDRVISLSEYELMATAVIREHFAIKGSATNVVKRFRDKLIMKEQVARHNIKAPVNDALQKIIDDKTLTMEGKIVLKPIDGASSQDISVYKNIDALREAVSLKKTGIDVIDKGVYDGFQVETFIDGDILHFDGMVVEGELIFVVANKYIGNCMNYAKGEPLGSVQIELQENHATWVQAVLDSLELQNGSFHLEAILDDDRLIFLEIANRVGGADVVNVVEKATGIHMPSTELAIYLGEFKRPTTISKSQKKFGWFVVPGHHINADSATLTLSEDFSKHDNILRWNQLPMPFEKLKHITYQAAVVPLAGLVQADSSQQVEALIREIFSGIELSEPVIECNKT
ncbi:MAG: ATP-grasp domain-containing protein [Francisellaceae bacterium]